MVLELHIWGPAFALPSIDPQCLATVAYLSLVVPKDAWVLVPSSDPSVSPTNELPALKNGLVWVSRFRNIVDYLRQYSEGSWDLDEGVGDREKADIIAFSSFIESRAHPLLDLSLYVTSQNYYANTSPSYARILQWPNQWILPPQLHSRAKSRTEHLGVSSLDLQAMDEQRRREHSAAVAAGQVPSTFIQRPRDTVSGLLGKTAQQNQFRLDALTEELFEPLEEMLGGGGGGGSGDSGTKYLLSGVSKSKSRPSSLDCLAVGYLALMLAPDLAYPWLRDAMQTKGPQVTIYTERLRQKWFGAIPLDPALVTTSSPSSSSPSSIPWKAPQRANIYQVSSTLLSTLLDSLPIIRDVRTNNRLRDAAADSDLSDTEQKALTQYSAGRKKDVFLSVAMVLGGGVALAAYMVRVGLVRVSLDSQRDDRRGRDDEVEDVEGLDLKASDFLGV